MRTINTISLVLCGIWTVYAVWQKDFVQAIFFLLLARNIGGGRPSVTVECRSVREDNEEENDDGNADPGDAGKCGALQ